VIASGFSKYFSTYSACRSPGSDPLVGGMPHPSPIGVTPDLSEQLITIGDVTVSIHGYTMGEPCVFRVTPVRVSPISGTHS
jgi:hypothetical protein